MKNVWTRISGWGNFPKVKANVVLPATIAEVQNAVRQNQQLIARGGGNSYGDSSLQNVIISTRNLTGIIAEGDTWIEVQAGISIEILLRHLVTNKKFLPVTPGTKAVTVGGAIAADIHGKNHLQAGSFFNVTQSFQIVVEGGELKECSREKNTDLFYSCFGGMGLQGIIVSAVIHVMALPSEWLLERQYCATDLNETLALMQQCKQAPYLVGWIDLLNDTLPGVVKTGVWLNASGNEEEKSTSFLTIPFRFPIAPPRFLFKWYNKWYLIKARQQPEHTLHYNSFFFPLDGIKNWRYVFGPKGLLQYHFLLPLPQAQQGIAAVLDKVKNSKATCTLAVLKLFGKGNIETPQAFTTEGFSVALDFMGGAVATALIHELDEIVLAADGRIYKAKDAVSHLPQALTMGQFQSLQNQRYEHK